MQEQESRLGMLVILALLSVTLVVVTVEWFALRTELQAQTLFTDQESEYGVDLATTCTITAASPATVRERCIQALQALKGTLAAYQSHLETEPSQSVGARGGQTAAAVSAFGQ